MIKNFQNIVVLGAGKSGVGAAILASKQNLNVVVYNDSNITEENINLLNNYGVKWYTQDYTSSDILDNDLLVISPGILDNHPVVKHFEEKSKPVISEIEFASYFCDAKKICITGTNGKTTTTLMVTHILEKAGLSVKAVGNIGESYSLSVALEKFDLSKALNTANIAKWEIAIPILIILSLFTGFATLVESAALLVLYVISVELFIYKDISMKDLPKIVINCATLVGGVLIILGFAMGFTGYLVDAQIPLKILNYVQSTISSKIIFLLALNILLLIVGCLMDVFSAIIVVVPLLSLIHI